MPFLNEPQSPRKRDYSGHKFVHQGGGGVKDSSPTKLTWSQRKAAEKEMEEAIGSEDYEKAAALRDQISQLTENTSTKH